MIATHIRQNYTLKKNVVKVMSVKSPSREEEKKSVKEKINLKLKYNTE